jgi:hypothetical protein
MARDRTGNTEAAERARLASAEMLENLERAGMGTSTQLGINLAAGGVLQQVMPIYVVDNSSNVGVVAGTDEIWMVTPSRLAMGEPCFDPGAKTPITVNPSGSNVGVACNSFASYTGAGHFVMMINGQGKGTGGLLSSPSIVGTTLSSTDLGTVTGFGMGDSIVGVQVLHYYIALNPNDKDPDGTQHPALFRASGSLSGGTATAPFTNAASPAPVAEIADVEDLQVVPMVDTSGLKDPLTYTALSGLPATPLIVAPQALKSMRVTLVSRSHLRSQSGDGNNANLAAQLAPQIVENHTPVVCAPTCTPDGYQRVTFGRRVELPNMAMTSF